MASVDPGPGFQAGDTAIPSTLGSTGVGAPVVRASDLLGSHRTVDAIVDRDAIPATFRDEGMTVWITTTLELYRLVGGLLNANWILEGSVASGVILVRDYVAGVVVRDVVYKNGVANEVDRADASAPATGDPEGVVRALDSPIVGQCLVATEGIDVPGFAGLVIGEDYILSTTPGGIVGVTDTGNGAYPAYLTPGSGEVLAPVGKAADATILRANATRGIQLVG